MRSKEVENSLAEMCNYMVRRKTTYTKLDRHDKAIDILLNYISEKEKENKFLRDENNIYKNETVSKSVIRDKIALYELEIETLKTLYPKTYTDNSDYYTIKIQTLKEILEK